LDQVRLLELTRRQVSADRAPHPLRVGPRPVLYLVRAPERQWHFVEGEIRSAMIAKRKHRDLLRSRLLIVGGYLSLEGARIQFDQMIKPVLFAVSFQTVLVAEKWPVGTVCLGGASTQNKRSKNYRRGEHRDDASAIDCGTHWV